MNIATVRRLPVPGAKVPATTLPNSRGIFYSLSVNFIFCVTADFSAQGCGPHRTGTKLELCTLWQPIILAYGTCA